MILGFTGTRNGMTGRQIEQLVSALREHTPTEFHHGDCSGSDEMAHTIVRLVDPKIKIVVHPPTDGKLRAHCDGDVILPPRPYLVRDHAIVDACAVLLVAPKPGPAHMRSGTWATHRYAKKLGRKYEVLKP